MSVSVREGNLIGHNHNNNNDDEIVDWMDNTHITVYKWIGIINKLEKGSSKRTRMSSAYAKHL